LIQQKVLPVAAIKEHSRTTFIQMEILKTILAGKITMVIKLSSKLKTQPQHAVAKSQQFSSPQPPASAPTSQLFR